MTAALDIRNAFNQTGWRMPERLLRLNEIAISQMRTLLERGIRSESLPPAEDVKKVERRLTNEEKRSLKKPDVLKKDTKP
jgi:hypothetical protein